MLKPHINWVESFILFNTCFNQKQNQQHIKSL
jgi:hypothetical protein